MPHPTELCDAHDDLGGFAFFAESVAGCGCIAVWSVCMSSDGGSDHIPMRKLGRTGQPTRPAGSAWDGTGPQRAPS